jgi:CheY-like chemotaxis protein
MVLDLGLADMSGFTLLEQIKNDPALQELPIIIYTGKELSPPRRRSCGATPRPSSSRT